MPILHQPIIREEDYEIFRELVGNDLPEFYGKWLLEQQAEGDGWFALWPDAQPEDIIRVKVSPAEFNSWCKKTDHAPNRLALCEFAEEKATRKAFR